MNNEHILLFLVCKEYDRSDNSRRGGVLGTWGSGQLGGGIVDLALPGKGDQGGQGPCRGEPK